MVGKASNSHDHQGTEPQGPTGVTCDQCGVVCPSAIHLARHLVLHDDDGPAIPAYTCASCNRKFRFLKQLIGHRETCRSDGRGSSLTWSAGGVSSTAVATTVVSSSYRCTVCDRQFTQCGALRRHERVHSGERPHACQACGKRFTQKCTLDRHVMLVHDGSVGGTNGSGSGGTGTSVSVRQRRGGRGNRREGGAGPRVAAAAAAAAADRAAGAVSSKLQSRGRRGRRDRNDSAFAASFAFDLSRRAPSPPSLFSDEESDDKVNSHTVNSMAGTCGANNEPATGSKATSSLATFSFDDEDDRKQVTSEKFTTLSSDSGDNRGVDSDSDASSITSSEAAYDPRRPHKCSQCGFAFKLAAHLKQHMVAWHSGGKQPYACDLCNRRYRTQGALHSHKVTHLKKMRYRCHKCGCRFVRKWSLQRHVLTHRLKPSHRCLLCGQRFGQMGNLELHLRSTHAGERPHRCDKCDSRFATAAKLRRHASTVHSTRAIASRQSKRPICSDPVAEPLAVAAGGVATGGSELAQTDALFVPEAKRRHRVEPSSSSTSDASIMSDVGRSRSKAHASGTVSASKRTNSASETTPEIKDSFVCRMCSSRFDCKRNLTRHEKAHIAPRLHGCLECGRCFTQRGNLNRHTRTVHQRPTDKSSATADIGRSQNSSNDGGDNVDRSDRASVVADRRRRRALGSAGQAKCGSNDGANRMSAGSQAKAVGTSKAGRRPGTCVSGQAGRTANTVAVEIASLGGCTAGSGSSNVDGQKNSGDDFSVGSLRGEIIARSDLVPCTLTSPPCNSSKISPSTTARESNAASDVGPIEHRLSLNVDDAVIGRLTEPNALQHRREHGDENSRECADASDHPHSPLELTVAEMEPGSRGLPSLHFVGGAVGRPLSSTICHVLTHTSDVAGNSEMLAVCRLSFVADSCRNGGLPAPCVDLPRVERTASTSVGLDNKVSGAQRMPSDAENPVSGSSFTQCVVPPRIEHMASTSVAPDSKAFGVQLTSSSSVGEVIGLQLQEMHTISSKEGNVPGVRKSHALLVERVVDESVDSVSKPRSHSSDTDLEGSATCLWDEVFNMQ